MSPHRHHKGDDGSTGILGDGRILKNDPRIETLGTLDESSAALGLARALAQNPQTISLLKEIQRDLYGLMAEVATPPQHALKKQSLDPARLQWLNTQAEALEANTPALHEFILPGDSLAGAALALARTIVRRAERRVVELTSRGEMTGEVILPYLNRLSSVCFLLELIENQLSGHETSLAKE